MTMISSVLGLCIISLATTAQPQCPCDVLCPGCVFTTTAPASCPPFATTTVPNATDVTECVCMPGFFGSFIQCTVCNTTDYCPINTTLPLPCPPGRTCNGTHSRVLIGPPALPDKAALASNPINVGMAVGVSAGVAAVAGAVIAVVYGVQSATKQPVQPNMFKDVRIVSNHV